MEIQKYISLGKHVINFGGESLWSNVAEARPVEVHVVIDHVKDGDDYESASVMAIFEEDQWNPAKEGYIYTDKTFKEELRDILVVRGYSDGLGYSESGMQGEVYVHFDYSVNDKLRNEEGNFIMNWEEVNEKQEIADLERQIKSLDMERKGKHERLCELKKKHQIK